MHNSDHAGNDHDTAWFVIQRWLAYEGEARANVLRLIALAAFYVIELINYYGLNLGVIELPRVVDSHFHATVTCLAAAWAIIGFSILYCQSHQFFPVALPYASTACDIGLLTSVLAVADGPRSALVVGYFLIIALSGLRFSLNLVRWATLLAVVGYAVLLGYAKWVAPENRLPRYQQLIVLVALALAGVIMGQVIRRVRDIAQDYAGRIDRV